MANLIGNSQALDEKHEAEVMSGSPEITGETAQDDEGHNTSDADEFPEGGYGWVVVACRVGFNAMTWGHSTIPARSPVN